MSEKINNISKTLELIRDKKMPDTFDVFGKVFQTKILSLILKDKVFSFSIIPILKIEYFTDPYLKSIYLEILKYRENYTSMPSIDNLSIILGREKENKKTYDKLLKDISDVDLTDREFVIDNSKKFCFTKHALEANAKVRELLEEGKFNEAQALSTESFKYSGLNTTKIYNLKKDYEMVFDEEKQHNPIPTPFPTFNNNMQGFFATFHFRTVFIHLLNLR